VTSADQPETATGQRRRRPRPPAPVHVRRHKLAG